MRSFTPSIELSPPIIIIGAGRSGTNILRDVLTRVDGLTTWPCDEINYIWRHGNARHPNDEFSADLASPSVRLFIRRAFRSQQNSSGCTVVEKTCANSLRVAFVDAVLPEARFIHIIRDGRDVVTSALQRWKAPLDLSYIVRKAKWVPLTDVPYYATRYLWNRLHRLVANEKRLATWGPRFRGLDEALQELTLPEVCALQWKRCVDRADIGLEQVDESRIHRLTYERFVADPTGELLRLGNFLHFDISAARLEGAAALVSPASVGNWKRRLDPRVIERVESLTDETLVRHGYH